MSDEAYKQWRRRILRQYPQAIIETMTTGRRITDARATYDYRTVLSTWTPLPHPTSPNPPQDGRE